MKILFNKGLIFRFFRVICTIYMFVFIFPQIMSSLIRFFTFIYYLIFKSKSINVKSLEQPNEIEEIVILLSFLVIAFLLVYILGDGKNRYLYTSIKFKRISTSDYFPLFIIIVLAIFHLIFFNSIMQLYQLYFPDSTYLAPFFDFGNRDVSSVGDIILSSMSVFLFAPVFEEFIFRGIIFEKLQLKFNIKNAIIIQALIFGISHGLTVVAIAATMIGIIFSLVYIKYKTIAAPIIVHSFANLFGIIGNGLIWDKISMSGIDSIILKINPLFTISLAMFLYLFTYAILLIRSRNTIKQ